MTPERETRSTRHFLGRVYFHLGELWEGKRDVARATRNYAKFIELW